jgi:hypothetical protein
MQIQRTDKLFIIKIINRNSAILITDINSILSCLDDSDIDIPLVFIKILERFASFKCNDDNVLIDTSDNDFAYFNT